jgi:L-alanine-DL-glutamate epimerase-like enolase superfamily enzyme
VDLHTMIAEPVIIRSIEALKVRGRMLVRTTSEEGAAGVAMVNDRLAYLWPILRDFVVPVFTGRDARDLQALIDEVYTARSAYKLAGLALWCPVAYLELSLLDMLGKLADCTVSEFLGDVVRREIPVYLSSTRRDTTPEEEVDWLAERLAVTGASAAKFKIGGRMSRNADARPGRTEDLVPLARRVFGDDVTIYVDANGSYDAEHAVEVAALLVDHGVAFLEEPCPWQDYWETKRVADALALPVAGGEQDSSLWTFDWMIRDRVVDIVQPDVMYNGGLMRCLKVGERAASAEMPIMPHSPKAGAEAAAVLHFGALAPNLGPHQEWSAKDVPPVSWYAPAFEICEGKVAVPDGPGLGVMYDPEIWREAEPYF